MVGVALVALFSFLVGCATPEPMPRSRLSAPRPTPLLVPAPPVTPPRAPEPPPPGRLVRRPAGDPRGPRLHRRERRRPLQDRAHGRRGAAGGADHHRAGGRYHAGQR